MLSTMLSSNVTLKEVTEKSLKEQLDFADPTWVTEAKLALKSGQNNILTSLEEIQIAAAKENEMMNYLRSVFISPLQDTVLAHPKPKFAFTSEGVKFVEDRFYNGGMHKDSCPSSPMTTTSTLTPSSSPPMEYGFMTSRSTESYNTMAVSDVVMTYQVQFLHFHKDCRLHSSLPSSFMIDCGSFVMIQSGEKDGLDMGIVTAVYNPVQYKHKMRSIGMSRDTEENKIGTILRLAMPSERLKLPEKVQKEAEIFSNVFHLVHRVFKLPLELKGVELQFDLRKLTVLYHSDSRVDFRELVRDLNLIYRVRIWMKKTNFCRPFEPNTQAAVSLRTGI